MPLKRILPLLFMAVSAAVVTPVFPAAAAAEGRLEGSIAGELSERLFGLPGLSKVGRVAPGIFRGAQPENEGYATLKGMGIRTIINLRSSRSEKEEVEKAGMKSIEVPMNAAMGIKRKTVDTVLDAMMKRENQPVFIHCRHGKDRTGAVVAIFRTRIQGWPIEAADEEMLSFGFNKIFFTLRNQVKEYSVTAQ